MKQNKLNKKLDKIRKEVEELEKIKKDVSTRLLAVSETYEPKSKDMDFVLNKLFVLAKENAEIKYECEEQKAIIKKIDAKLKKKKEKLRETKALYFRNWYLSFYGVPEYFWPLKEKYK